MRSFLNNLVRCFRTAKTVRSAPRAPRRAYLQVEGLEDRLVLSATSVAQLPTFVTKELTVLQTSIDQQIFDKAMPLIGTALSKLGTGSATDPNPINRIVGSFKQALIDGAEAAITGGPQAVQAAIIKDLGEGAGSILQGITTTSGANGNFTAQVHLAESGSLNSGNVDLNLALPGLPIQFAAQNLAVNVEAGYDIELAFGMAGGSPFLKTVANPSNTANPLGVALDLNAQIATGSTLSATLGGLTATLSQPAPRSVVGSPISATLGLTAAVAQPGPQSAVAVADVARLPGGGLPSPILTSPPSTFDATLDFGFSVSTTGGIQFVTPKLTGAANINLQASLSLADNPTLPSVTAGLTVTWAFNSANPTATGVLGNAPTVAFNNVTVDLGSFLTNVVEPVVTSVQHFTEPLEIVAEALTTPLPGVTTVTNYLGMSPITLANLLGGSSASSLTTFAKTIEFINGLQIPATGSIAINVGSFNLTDARKTTSTATNFVENAAVKQHGLLGAAGGQVQSTYSSLQTKADIDFPMLDNPVSFVSSVLLGHQVNLVKATLGVDFSAGINVDIPIIGIPHVASIDANFFGSLTLDAGATFVLTDGFLVGGSLLNSLQVQNAHMDVGLTLGVGGSATVLGFGASLDATVSVTFDLGLTNKTTGSTTFTGSDLLDGNVALDFSKAQLRAGAQLDLDSPFGSATLVSITAFTENLIDGSTSSGGGVGGGGGGGGLGNGSDNGHQQD